VPVEGSVEHGRESCLDIEPRRLVNLAMMVPSMA
jgi:hypothetical protein